MTAPRVQPPLALTLSPEALGPLVEAVVEATLARLEAARAQAGDRLAYSEAEAAALLGLQQHQLRDLRLRGEIGAAVGPGRKILYSRETLVSWLASRKWEPTSLRAARQGA